MIQVPDLRRQCVERGGHIVGNDFDDPEVVVDAMIDVTEIARDVANGQFDDQAFVLLPEQCVRATLRHDLARIHDRDFIAKDMRFVHVMCGQDDRGTVREDALHQLPEVAACLRVQARRGLVREISRAVG